ncbi:hypothetical protein VTN77DRAFT_8418 [Rasamsonia byssochlamydoides]|uniref:uncharacterized protein n=1 Tax=Rasamsonia byssochlamydoides TaxID=89139 RepID=UPI003743CD63
MIPRETIIRPARALCAAFARGASTTELLTHFTEEPMPVAYEHGHPDLAPFLGRPFNGIDGVGRYFDLIASLISFQDMRFDREDEWVVDQQTLAVCVRGRARFIWKATGEAWDETFCYRLGIAEDVGESSERSGHFKIQEYRVWADTGAAYLASQGQLRDLEQMVDQKEGRTRRISVAAKEGDGDSFPPKEALGSGMKVYGSCG